MTKFTKTTFTLALTGLALFASACATVEGVGKDVETAGEKIQDAVDSDE